MFNIPPIKTTEAIKPEILPDITKVWQVGQILNARAETSGSALSKIILRLGEYRLEAQTPIDVKAGDTLKLLVKELGDPPLLSIQAKADRPGLAAEQLKLFIGQQADTQQSLRQLQALQQNPGLPRQIQQSLQNLLQQIPSLSQATDAESLKSLIQNNPAFLEARLLNKMPVAIQNNLKSQLLGIRQQLLQLQPSLKQPPTAGQSIEFMQQALKLFQQGQINSSQLINDFITSLPAKLLDSALNTLNSPGKVFLPDDLNALFTQLIKLLQKQPSAPALLEQLKSRLQSLPALQELKSSLDSLINKITSQQLIPLSREMDNSLLLLFSLLLKEQKDLYLLDFKIEEHPGSKEKNHKDWLVNIKFEFSSLGIIQARVHLLDDQVSTLFQAEKPATVALINTYLPQLENMLQQSGFSIMQLYAEQKNIKVQPELPSGVHILDEKA